MKICFLNSPDPVRLLITFGASITKADRVHQSTALHWACMSGNHLVVKMLLDAGASTETPNGRVSFSLKLYQ